jgi:hypothetical protein
LVRPEAGTVIDRPSAKSEDAGEDLTDWQQKIAILVNGLTHDVPLEREEQTAEQRARWILAHVLDWHRRDSRWRRGFIPITRDRTFSSQSRSLQCEIQWKRGHRFQRKADSNPVIADSR